MARAPVSKTANSPYQVVSCSPHTSDFVRYCSGRTFTACHAIPACDKQSGGNLGGNFGVTAVTQSTDDWPYDFGEFSLVPDVDPSGPSPVSLRHRPSGHIWHFNRADDGTLTSACETIKNPSSEIDPQALKGEAVRACNEILKQVRKEAVRSCRQDFETLILSAQAPMRSPRRGRPLG